MDNKPCPFCNGGETRFDEIKHWTGQRYVVVSVTLRHWCEGEDDRPITITVTRRTMQECVDAWNDRK